MVWRQNFRSTASAEKQTNLLRFWGLEYDINCSDIMVDRPTNQPTVWTTFYQLEVFKTIQMDFHPFMSPFFCPISSSSVSFSLYLWFHSIKAPLHTNVLVHSRLYKKIERETSLWVCLSVRRLVCLSHFPVRNFHAYIGALTLEYLMGYK